jgi:hypothetical protein
MLAHFHSIPFPLTNRFALRQEFGSQCCFPTKVGFGERDHNVDNVERVFNCGANEELAPKKRRCYGAPVFDLENKAFFLGTDSLQGSPAEKIRIARKSVNTMWVFYEWPLVKGE